MADAGVGEAAAAGGAKAAGEAGAGAAAAGTGAAAAGTAAAAGGIGTTLAEGAAIASAASAIYGLASGPGRVNIPPSPLVPQARIDQQVENAEQQALGRRQAAAGLTSTLGTAGGEAGAMLNPSTLSSKSLLGG